jgi:hypothetical protein
VPRTESSLCQGGCFGVLSGALEIALWREDDDGHRVGVGSGNDLTEELAVGM